MGTMKQYAISFLSSTNEVFKEVMLSLKCLEIPHLGASKPITQPKIKPYITILWTIMVDDDNLAVTKELLSIVNPTQEYSIAERGRQTGPRKF